jgi:hypothetical protein
MKPLTATALSLSLSLALAACATVDDAPADDATGAASAALENTFAAAFASEHGVAALGHLRAGAVTLQCTGAFLDNRWVLTHRRCIEGLPSGTRVVVSNAVSRSFTGEAAPLPSDVTWVGVAERSALSSMPDLALVRLERDVATGRRGITAVGAGFRRALTPTTRPITSNTDLRCFGFSLVNGRMRLGERLVRVMNPAPVAQALAGIGEVSSPTDDGGACFASDGTLAATLRALEPTRFEVVDLTRAPDAQGEIRDAPPASDAAARAGLWPITLTDTVGRQTITARTSILNGHTVVAGASEPIWAQGFMNVELARTSNSIEVLLQHRGTGRCLAATNDTYTLATCSAARPAPAAQRFRVFFLDDGSVQILNAAQQRCLTAASGRVIAVTCNAATGGQRWSQGLGRP